MNTLISFIKRIQENYPTTIYAKLYDDGSGCIEHCPYYEDETILEWNSPEELITLIDSYHQKLSKK